MSNINDLAVCAVWLRQFVHVRGYAVHVRGYAVRTWWTLWPRFRGSRARVADRRRAISDAVKPMDIAPFPSFPYTTSCTLRVTPSLILYAHIVPIRHRYPTVPIRHRYPTVHRTMWLIVGHCDAPAFALIVQCGPKNLLSLRLLWLIGRFIPFGPPSYQP